jgi:hypothetical protein
MVKSEYIMLGSRLRQRRRRKIEYRINWHIVPPFDIVPPGI